jgi:chromosome segregation protein
MKGVIGPAADLVRAEERLMPVIDLLLGRTLVVHDLEAARCAFDLLQGGFQIATLSGEILRSSGSVTGGQGQGLQQGWLLAREREWRELPRLLADAREQTAAAQSALEDARAAERRAQERYASLAVLAKSCARAEAAAEAELGQLERRAAQDEQQVTWHQRLLAQAESRAVELSAQEVLLDAQLSRLAEEISAAKKQVDALQAQLDSLRGDGLYAMLSDARSAIAVARRNCEHRSSTLNGARDRHSELVAQLEQKRERLTRLRQEENALAANIQAQASRERVIDAWLSGLVQKTEPAEAAVAQMETEVEQLGSQEATLRTRLREAESNFSEAQLAHSREEDRRQRLRRQIMDDFGLVDMESMEDQPDQPPLPLAELVSTLPVVDALPAGLEDEVRQLRGQIKRLGPTNPGALAEYAEVRDRHSFLSAQAADLEEASHRLREVVAELDEVMRRQFGRTFETVEARFRENFTRLFGGGMARLSLTEPEDFSTTGVEITARPPGKRQQTLALLSGGERSLTAVALIFAFLQTSPPPFCILDEVDAMLDEANVQRFRAMLQELAQTTEFIVITHNRTTIQAADTIYGVSMGEDSASQVVSLRLEGDRVATPTGATVELRAD